MKLSQKQREDLDSALYFAPTNCFYKEVTNEDIKRYFDMSDKGIGKKEIEYQLAKENQEKAGRNIKYSGLAKIIHGKRNRDLQITSYLEDWGNGISFVDFDSEPEQVVKFISRSMKKPAIMMSWHRSQKNYHARQEYKISKGIEEK